VSKKGPESLIQSAIMDYLAARHILAFRMNSGATIMPATENFKRRFIRYGVKGMADILAFQKTSYIYECKHSEGKWDAGAIRLHRPIWLEVKADKGKTTPDQDAFAAMVRAYGQAYHVVRSVEDVEAVL